MMNNHTYLHNKHTIRSIGQVQVPTRELATVSHIGSLQLNATEVISNVLCIPTFRFNLLSVNKMTMELNCCVSFFPTHCIFQDLSSGKIKGIGKLEEGLYVMHWNWNEIPQGNNSLIMSAIK